MPSNDVAMEGVLPSRRQQLSHLFKFRNPAYGHDTPGPTTRLDSPSLPTSPTTEMEVDTPQKSKKARKSKASGERTPKRTKAVAV